MALEVLGPDHVFTTSVSAPTAVDGVIDGCTAHVALPYTNGAMPDPIWDYGALAPVVAAADKAGIQVALHAIGDAAVRNALDAIENAYRENGTGPGTSAERRHL